MSKKNLVGWKLLGDIIGEKICPAMFGASFRIHLVCYSLHFYLQFELTAGWNVTVNLYMLCVANKVPELIYYWGLSNI